ncbi:hypothetical protein ACKFKF_12840 [Phormidesmis sp. 146-12]
MLKIQLSFHTSFALKKEDLLKVFEAASEESGLEGSLEERMEKTGLGNKKVGPMKSWAVRSGLMSSKTLSPEGKLVWKYDSRLKSLNTDWLMHFHLSLGDKGLQTTPINPADWGGWTYLIYNFLPQNRAFTTENLTYEASTHFDDDDKLIAKNYRYALRAYIESDAIAACKILTSPSKDKFLSGNPQLPNSNMVGYLLAKLWQRDFGNHTSILTEDILNHPMGLPKVLSIDSETCQAQLNALEAKGIIEQRCTVSPFQVIRRWQHPLELLEAAYAAH